MFIGMKIEMEQNKNDRFVEIPDENFKKYLIDSFDNDGDGEISYDEALSIVCIWCKDMGIESLKGIECFQNLKMLNCAKNKLELLDLSSNKNLEYLSCYQNYNLKYLDLSKTPRLTHLYCGGCNLSYLDCSQNLSLQVLSCIFNPFDMICFDLKNNKALEELRVRRCNLYDLNLINQENLKILDCSENKLDRLDLSFCTELEYLDCSCCELQQDLYLTNNLKLKELRCRGNKSLFNIIVESGQHIENVVSHITPATKEYIDFLRWREYQQESVCPNIENTNSDWRELLDDAFEGGTSNYWNID